MTAEVVEMATRVAFSVKTWSSRNFSRWEICGRGILRSSANMNRVDIFYRGILETSRNYIFRLDIFIEYLYKALDNEKEGLDSYTTLLSKFD